MKIALATRGMWQLQEAIKLLTGAESCLLSTYGMRVDMIAGWGHKSTAARARRIAQTKNVPYVAFEDGFLRSVFPGKDELPLSMVLDRTGIYYDARQPSDLQACIRRRASTPLPLARIRHAIDGFRTRRLSKYNNATLDSTDSLCLKAARRQDRLLVIDQTAGDASISGALATGDTFVDMLVCAVRENPGAEILVRVHPETMLGRKAGHFSQEQLQDLARKDPVVAKARASNLLRLTPEPVNPWVLLEACGKVYCVSSQLGFEGVLAGCEVHSFGASFYNGWGITVDRSKRGTFKRAATSLEAVFAAVYFDYTRYLHHEDRRLIDFEEAIELMVTRISDFRRQGRF